MDEPFDLSHPALTLRYWQAVVTFGATAVEHVLAQPRWRVLSLNPLDAQDMRAKKASVLSGELIYDFAGNGACVDDYYADPDGRRYYAVSRKRKWPEPSSAETDGLVKIPNQEALLSCGAFCLFMASDRGAGYFREKDPLRFGNDAQNASARKKLLWTIDERGANFIQEQQPWDSFRGVPTHINVSQRAYFGGEAWRSRSGELTINSASREFGYNRDFPSPLIVECEKRYEAAIQFLRQLKLKITARPLGTR